MEVLGCISVFFYWPSEANQPKNTFHCYLIETRAGRNRGERGKRMHPRQVAPSTWEKCSEFMYSNMPLADIYLPQKALRLKGWKKVCKWKESRCLEIKPSSLSQTCRMAKLGKELTNIYLVSEKYYKTSCLLWQPFQSTPAHTGKMRSELPVHRMKSRAAELASSSSIQLWQLLLQVTESTGRFFTISRWAFTVAIS